MKLLRIFAALALCLSSCRTSPPVFSELPPPKDGAEAHDHHGPYANITGAKPGTKEEEIRAALISAMHRTHITSFGHREEDVRRFARDGAGWILRGDKVSISFEGRTPEETELALQDLRAAGLTVNLSP